MKKIDQWEKILSTMSSGEASPDSGTPTAQDIRENCYRVFRHVEAELKKKEAPIGGHLTMDPVLTDTGMKLNARHSVERPRRPPPEQADGEEGVLV